MTRWTVSVLALAALKIAFGVAGSAYSILHGSTPDSGAVPAGFSLLHMLVYGGVGLILVVNRRFDTRALWLGVAFLLLAAAPSDRLFSLLAGSAPWADSAVRILSHLHPDAFMPLYFWLFFSSFPRASEEGIGRVVSRLGVRLSAVAGVALFLVHASPLLPASLSRRWVASFEPSPQLYLYTWATLLLLTVPACIFAVWRVRQATTQERRRARLFVAGLVAGSVPFWGVVLFRAVSPSAGAWLSQSPQVWIATFGVRLVSLTIPVSTAYSVLVHHVLDVKLIVRQALRYALARYAVMTATAVPFAALLFYLYRNRDTTISEILSGTGPIILITATLLGLVMIRVRKNLLVTIDRRFFREHYDARQTLMSLVEGSRRATSPRELADLLSKEIDRALHLERISIFVLDTTLGELRNGGPDTPPIALASPLAMLVSAQEEPLEIEWSRANAALERLPEEDRQWLDETGFRLLVPFISSDGTLVGIAGLGEKRSERPYTREDRRLLSTIASSAALTLENRIKLSSPGDVAAVSTSASSDEPLALECESCRRVMPSDATECRTCGGELFASPVPYVLSSKFRLEQRIGAGGMGVVYRAVDLALGRRVAIKTLPQLSMESASRLRREARAMATVMHGNLALIYGVESFRSSPLLIVELLEGGTLSTRLSSGRLPMQEVVALGITIADVLEVLHDAGILHRDIKPSNVGYDTAGTPKLLDFGLAKILGDSRLTSASGPGRYEDLEDVPVAALTELTATRRVVGTPIYLSPEAASGEPADALFDLWALAVVLFEAAAGAHPLLSQGTAGLRKRIFEGDVADIRTLIPDCGPAPANFFDRALARDRAARPQTAAEFRERLQETRSRL